MSDVAKKSGYSMGTIYSHFESKEDLLVTCATALVEEHQRLIGAVCRQSIPAIEKIIASALCSWLISIYHADLIEIDNLSLMPSVWRRSTPQRADDLTRQHGMLANIFLALVDEAITNDLRGYRDLQPENRAQISCSMAHGLWGLCVGLSSTEQSGYSSSLCSGSDDESYAHFATNYINFLKGYGWHDADPDTVFLRCKAVASQAMEATTWFASAATP